MKFGNTVRPVRILWLVLFAYLEIVGLVHSFGAHNEGDRMYAVIIPPVAWYRALEFWWHADPAVDDWNARFDEDVTLIATVMNSSVDPDTAMQRLNREAITFLADRLKGYPAEQVAEIEILTTEYCAILIAMVDEVAAYHMEQAAGDGLPEFALSAGLAARVGSFQPFPSLYDMTLLNLNAIKVSFSDNMPPTDEGEFEQRMAVISVVRAEMIRGMQEIYQKVFGRRFEYSAI